MDLAIVNDEEWLEGKTRLQPTLYKSIVNFLEMEKRTRLAYRVHRKSFPSAIWHCCQNTFFTQIATNPLEYNVFNELVYLHQYAEICHKDMENENNSEFVELNHHGQGTSTVAYRSLSREEREGSCRDEYHAHGTRRQESLRDFARFVMEILPFLYAKDSSACGSVHLRKKLCTHSICCLLGISRNFLYNRKIFKSPDSATDDQLENLIDSADIRLRQLRRTGKRGKFPPLRKLLSFECGCDTPCFYDVPVWSLVREYTSFVKNSILATKKTVFSSIVCTVLFLIRPRMCATRRFLLSIQCRSHLFRI